MNNANRDRILVMIVDDHELVRIGLRQRIEREDDMIVCGEAEDVRGGLEVMGQESPDVAIVDISLKTGSGLDLVERMMDRNPSLKIIVLSMHDEIVYAERALQTGAQGFVHKQEAADKLIEAIRHVRGGQLYASDAVIQRMLNHQLKGTTSAGSAPVEALTNRELAVFERLGQGETVRQIAEALHLSPKTVETYRDRIRAKLNIGSAHELLHYAFSWVRDDNLDGSGRAPESP